MHHHLLTDKLSESAMDNINFSALAPRVGSRPMMSSWNHIGVSSMNGGAFSWGSIWSGLKNFGNSAKSFGSKVWNSSTGQKLRQKLKDTNAQEKLVDGIAAGVHGALDIANQEVAKAIEKRLDRPVVPLEPTKEDQIEELIEESKEIGGKKRPIEEEEEIITKVDGPPSYEELFGNKDSAPLVPMTRPIPSMARPVVAPTLPPAVDVPTTLDLPPPPSPPPRPTRRPAPAPPAVVVRPPPAFTPAATGPPRAWQSTLSSIVGAGVRTLKRRRCYRY